MDQTLPRLFLIRHGDTDWTQTGQHTGTSDIPLNALGLQRAQTLKDRLSGCRFTQVYTSPRVRARKTCEIAGFADAAVVHEGLAEWDYGDYDGKTSAQIKQARPDWDIFRDGGPNGESPEQIAKRADRFIADVRQHPGDVAGFGSGHIIRVIAARWLGLPPDAARYFFCQTASIGVLGYEHNLSQPVIRRWNLTEGALVACA
jgi:probable phosphoglycerate mutase